MVVVSFDGLSYPTANLLLLSLNSEVLTADRWLSILMIY